ncbi:hypothetical protein H7K45_20840 [Mycobacterium yunnanensis]|uniref:Uncharacterized protein n=1 Tax=Mycobacterium yunnanensis TaxID=368477 RepID=A0A9X2Z423_9MYCO|nr:hypothetical protein [Mycobacterium yunnanensis]MCV7423003.1 hypothetical protein [Mycobacterium yunnanensis]
MAELPPLTVALGPVTLAPVVGAVLFSPAPPVPPALPVVVVGGGEIGVLGASEGGEVVAGMLLEGVVAGTLVSLALSSLPQPESSASATEADPASRPMRLTS